MDVFCGRAARLCMCVPKLGMRSLFTALIRSGSLEVSLALFGFDTFSGAPTYQRISLYCVVPDFVLLLLFLGESFFHVHMCVCICKYIYVCTTDRELFLIVSTCLTS